MPPNIILTVPPLSEVSPAEMPGVIVYNCQDFSSGHSIAILTRQQATANLVCNIPTISMPMVITTTKIVVNYPHRSENRMLQIAFHGYKRAFLVQKQAKSKYFRKNLNLGKTKSDSARMGGRNFLSCGSQV